MKALIIITALNEAPSLNLFLPRLFQATSDLKGRFDVLLVDDGSSDATAQVAKKHGCLVIRNKTNCGLGTGISKGYRLAVRGGYDVAITLDADGQHDPKFLLPMFEQLNRGADIVVASRYHPKSERIGVPFDRDLLNISVTAQIRALTGWKITDALTGFWMMRRPCFKFALKHNRLKRYGGCLEQLIKFWYLAKPRPKLVEIPHPAIYDNHGTLSLLTRTYSENNREHRVERFGTHALHVVEVIEDVKKAGYANAVEREIKKRRGTK